MFAWRTHSSEPPFSLNDLQALYATVLGTILRPPRARFPSAGHPGGSSSFNPAAAGAFAEACDTAARSFFITIIARSLLAVEGLDDEHTIAVREEAISLGHGMLVCRQGQLPARERRHQQQQARLRQ